MTTPRNDIWIGLIELLGPPENPILEHAAGAYSNYVVACDDPSSFRRAAEASAAELGLVVGHVLWCEPLSQRAQRYNIEGYLWDLAREVSTTRHGRFGVFHLWESDQ